jgi:hypothetical protein
VVGEILHDARRKGDAPLIQETMQLHTTVRSLISGHNLDHVPHWFMLISLDGGIDRHVGSSSF